MASLIFSEEHCLLCTIDSNGRYYVINGGWEGIRNGDDFEVIYHPQGHPNNKHLTITDWVSMSRKDFDKKYPDFGY